MNNLKAIGKRIKQARTKQKISQIDFANQIQISTTHLSEIENGKTNYGIDVFCRITEALQVSADWLLQTDVPEVKNLQINELNSLLEDCSSLEVQSILEVSKTVKKVLKNK